MTTVRRAMIMLYQGMAKALDEQYQSFDFSNWLKLEVKDHHQSVGLVNRKIRVPRVLLLVVYDRIPRRQVRFSRHNIFLRDKHVCQYCGESYSRQELNLDHVLPRSRGGKTTWENVVCCCVHCNHRKGGHLPHEVGMNLIKEPGTPPWIPFIGLTDRKTHYEEWVPYLSMVTS
jgi:5-methylcytosine-specific restriction endonuclease McrA